MRLVRDGKAPAVKLVRAYDKGAEYKALGALVTARHPLDRDDRWRDFVGFSEVYYELHVKPHLTHAANHAIDAWETGVNEDHRKRLGETPDFQDWEMRAHFEAGVARCIARDGKKPIVIDSSVGNPSGTRDEQRRAWTAALPALRVAHELGGYVGLHAYGNVPGWEFPLVTLIEVLQANGLAALPILITECGNEPGWKDHISQGEYAARLIRYDMALARYPQVKAAFLYQFGDSGEQWGPYDLEGAGEVIDALVRHGQGAVVAQPAPEPLFSFHGRGKVIQLYNAPRGTPYQGPKVRNHPIDVWEKRDGWWRVTPTKWMPPVPLGAE